MGLLTWKEGALLDEEKGVVEGSLVVFRGEGVTGSPPNRACWAAEAGVPAP
jgi:hypothetical protein